MSDREPPPELHPRDLPVIRAKAELEAAIFAVLEKYSLSSNELFWCLTSILEELSKAFLRNERRSDETG